MGNDYREIAGLICLAIFLLSAVAFTLWDLYRVERARCLSNFSAMGEVEYRLQEGCFLKIDGEWMPVKMRAKLIPEIIR